MAETAKYSPMRLTLQGRHLIAKVQNGQGNIKITKFATGSGVYTEDEDYSLRTDLKKKEQEFAIVSKTIKNDDSIVLEVVITNKPEGSEGLLEGYKIREMAFYAMDPDEGEILYCIMAGFNDLKMDYLPAYNGILPSVITNYFYIKVANAETVEITVDLVDRVYSKEGASGLRIYNNKMQYLNDEGNWININVDASDMVVEEFEQDIESFPSLSTGMKLKQLFGNIKSWLLSLKKRTEYIGRVFAGPEEDIKNLEKNGILFVVEDWVEPDPPKVFHGAAYDNMIFAEHAPTTGENWAEMFSGKGGRAGEENRNIITGKLVVSEEEPSDATFFTKIEK